MATSPVDHVWPKPCCQAPWKGEEHKAEMGRQHKEMDRPGVCQVAESRCQIICGAPTTLTVKGQLIIMKEWKDSNASFCNIIYCAHYLCHITDTGKVLWERYFKAALYHTHKNHSRLIFAGNWSILLRKTSLSWPYSFELFQRIFSVTVHKTVGRQILQMHTVVLWW